MIVPLISQADEPSTPFQVSIFDPAQLYPDDYSVACFRFDLFYGSNKDLQGIDLGLVNMSDGSVDGLEIGAVNIVKREFKGVQAGLFFNDVQEEMHGLQIGLVNHTESLYGIQIGLLNFNDVTNYLGFFPFINAAF